MMVMEASGIRVLCTDVLPLIAVAGKASIRGQKTKEPATCFHRASGWLSMDLKVAWNRMTWIFCGLPRLHPGWFEDPARGFPSGLSLETTSGKCLSLESKKAANPYRPMRPYNRTTAANTTCMKTRDDMKIRADTRPILSCLGTGCRPFGMTGFPATSVV